MLQVALGLDILITLWHSEQMERDGFREAPGWWNGRSISEFGMVIVAGRFQQLHDRRPPFRRSLSAAQDCAFEMRYGVADSTGIPVVVKSETFSEFAAQNLSVMDRAAVRALMVIVLAPLFLHCPGHIATPLEG